MNPAWWYLWSGLGLFAIGLWGVASPGQWLRRIVAVNLMGSGVFLLLVMTAYRTPPAEPDPVPHALVLTGIVVAVSATALALALLRRVAAAQQREREAARGGQHAPREKQRRETDEDRSSEESDAPPG